MHNIYNTLSCMCYIDGLVILQNITIQNISKANFKKRFLKMTTFTSKHNITNENKTIQHKHCLLKSKMKNKIKLQ
jgi:hypothetical protein